MLQCVTEIRKSEKFLRNENYPPLLLSFVSMGRANKKLKN